MSRQLDEITASLLDVYAKKLDSQQRAEMLEALDVLARDAKYNVFKNTFPEDGKYSIHAYPKHKEFFDASATYTESAFIAGNRTGKSVAGAYLTVCHATGIYPDWWKGKRYHKPIMIWVGGDTSVTCRDIIQFKLLGDIGDHGSGMIPKDLIVDTKTRRNVPDAVETIRIRHISGGISTIVIKTYEQGRIAWQGSEVDFIWIDEECPQDVYGEALIRLMTTKGSIILTFTPLNGLTPLVLTFIDGDQHTDAEFPKFVANCTWNDVPHLDEQDIAKMLAATPPNLRDARSKGIPTVGDGVIYPLPLDHITVDDFKIPKWWPRAYGMDVGWNCTAASFGAWDRENDIIYIYSEHKQGQADVSVHSSAIRSRGKWMKGAIDPASRASSQTDGTKLFLLYAKNVDQGGGGLNLTLAANAVEAGIFTVWDRLQSGRLKYFKSCTQLQREHGLYHRKDGKVVKTNDHLQDCLHPDTSVITKVGNVRIKDLVGESGYVLTINGVWAEFKNCRKTRSDSEMVTVVFKNGSKVSCTPDHLFLTENGWVKAVDMAGLMCYDAVSQSIKGGTSWPSLSSRKNSKNLMEKFTGCAESIFSDMVAGFTLLFGKAKTAKSRLVSIFTTKTKIGQITTTTTSSCCEEEPTYLFTTKGRVVQCHLTHLPPPQNGTEAQKGSLGTTNIMQNMETGCIRRLILFVTTVVPRMLRQKCSIDSAQIIANPVGEENQVSTTLNVPAKNVAQPISLIDTPKLKPVPGHVVSKCLSVTEAPTSDTYCLEVEGFHAFAVENGVIVHNCIRYLCMADANIWKYPESEVGNRGQKVIDLASYAQGWT